MLTIVPAIIPLSIEDLKNHLALLKDVTHSVQVDIVDGKFVPFTSWPHKDETDVQTLASIAETYEIEVDLMIESPEECVDEYVRAGIKAAVIHLESTNNMKEIIDILHAGGVQAGLSLLNDTPLEALDPFLSEIDYVQLMGIRDIGSQGQPFDERVLDRITSLCLGYPKLPISIDGGVNKDTIMRLKKAGATRFVSGSAIFGEHEPDKAYRSLVDFVHGG